MNETQKKSEYKLIELDYEFVVCFIEQLPINNYRVFEMVKNAIVNHAICAARHAFKLQPELRDQR